MGREGMSNAIHRRAIVAAMLCTGMLEVAHADGQQCLSALERTIEGEHRNVRSLLPQQFDELARNGTPVLLLDVREPAEYAVSGIPGAIRVDPSISAEQFLQRFGDWLNGRTVVLYCSVGVRSSRLVERIDGVARQRGADDVVNLRGGIFAWHNYGRRLHQSAMPTDFVHPYSRRWSRYLDFPELARSKPATETAPR